MFQRKIVDPERGTELFAGQVCVDHAKVEGQVV
jgi:hypothetical protein